MNNFSNNENYSKYSITKPIQIDPNPFNYSLPYDKNSEHQKNLVQIRGELESLIDYKISQNNEKFLTKGNENYINLRKDLEKIFLRLDKIEKEKKTLNEKEKDSFINNDNIGSLKSLNDLNLELDNEQMQKELHNRIKIYKEELDIDTYLYFSLAFSFTALPLFFSYFRVIFCKKGLKLMKRLQYLLTVLLSPLLLFPGILTPFLQLFCIYYVYNEAEEDFSSVDKVSYQLLKILILIIFVFMVAKETTQAINSFFYCFLNARHKGHYFLAGCFLPPLMQATMAFLILYVGLLLIVSTDGPVDLIQNFASVYVLLEVDNIFMNFLKLSKISIFIVKMNIKMDILRSEIGVRAIFGKETIMKVLVESSLEIDYEDEHPNYRRAFLISRAILMIGLAIYTVLVWYYGVMDTLTMDSDFTFSWW